MEIIPFRDTPYFSSLFCDYIDNKEVLKPFYNKRPTAEGISLQAKEKALAFSPQQRHLLVEALKNQYKNTVTSSSVLSHIDALANSNTFTVTTGHQLCLFTGPVYFIYKIITVINAVERLNKMYPDYRFVPMYWMASEDHDFEEINHFMLNSKKINWDNQTATKGATGQLSTKGLEHVFQLISLELGSSKKADFLKTLFEEAYLKNQNMAAATRTLVNALFQEYGLVVIDGDDAGLKCSFSSIFEKELFQGTCFEHTSQTIDRLKALGYHIQANPRPINLFYLSQGNRQRILKTEQGFETLDGSQHWATQAIKDELHKTPENFSPNALLRPAYQEYILPNVCYVGGGGELAYWLELKPYFDAIQLPFPVLLPRNSVLLASEKQMKKCAGLAISAKDLFMEKEAFINKRIRQISNIDIDFSEQKKNLWDMFQKLHEVAKQTDPSFSGAVKAQEAKQLKGLKNLEKRLVKAQRRVLKDDIERAMVLKNSLFPNGGLQERYANFSEFYMAYGQRLIPLILEKTDPFQLDFYIVEVD